jgi:hypothetical protein
LVQAADAGSARREPADHTTAKARAAGSDSFSIESIADFHKKCRRYSVMAKVAHCLAMPCTAPTLFVSGIGGGAGIQEVGQGLGRENANHSHHDRQFYQGEAFLVRILLLARLLSSSSCVRVHR